jgi:hypothetical protein
VTNIRLPALLAVALAATFAAHADTTTSPLPGQVSPRVSPSPNCMDARGVREMNQVTPDTISLRAADQSTWRVTFTGACPDVMASTNPRILAEDSWVCGTGKERVTTDSANCTVASIAPISSREFAAEARQTDRNGVATLAAVTVQEEQRTLRGSPSYCFNTRHVRGYADNAKGFTVQTNARRSGGHGEYVVEVGANCRSLVHSPEIQFRSGFGTNMICGNPGDVVVVNQPINAPGESGIPMDRNAGLRKADIGIGDRCDVLAVYPSAP